MWLRNENGSGIGKVLQLLEGALADVGGTTSGCSGEHPILCYIGARALPWRISPRAMVAPLLVDTLAISA